MPITFDEVSAEIRPEPRAAEPGAAAPAPAARAEELRDQLRRELQLQAERDARLCDG